ncbi:MAG: DNA polymerase III subunit beta [Parachlamydiales bacterium]|nr:DNA polymerase III subunit beta [Parachlamydiales bacterium]
MKAVISKNELINLISKIQSIVAAKPAIPFLANVLIEAIDDQIILSATDLTTSMRCYAEAKIIEEGAIALPARKLFQLVRELIAPQVKITAESNEIAEIISGSSVFKIKGLHKSEFPSFPETTGAAQIEIDSSILKSMLSRVSFAAEREDNRYMMNSIFLKIENQLMTCIGTDGKRIAKTFNTLNIDPSLQGSYVLPLKAVEEMIRILEDNAERAIITLTPDKVFLENNNVTLITKLLSGQYPNVDKVIPRSPKITISLHREELISLLRQVSLFTAEDNHSVRFVFENNELNLQAASRNIGEGTVKMPVDYAQEKLEIAFNPFYFMDILRHSKEETVNFFINDAFNPGMITDTTNAIFVIMPMRLNNPEPTPETDAATEPALK